MRLRGFVFLERGLDGLTLSNADLHGFCLFVVLGTWIYGNGLEGYEVMRFCVFGMRSCKDFICFCILLIPLNIFVL